MATSDFALLTVENTGGALALKRKSAAEVVPEAASPIYGTASGNPAVLTDAAGERVFRSAKVNIEPQQEGSGDPSPDNVRPISGWTAAKVTRCGKNLLDPDFGGFRVISSYLVRRGVVPKGCEAYMSFRDKDTTVDISDIYIGFVSADYVTGTMTKFNYVMQRGVIGGRRDNRDSHGTNEILTGVVVYPKTEDAFNRLFARYDIQVELGSAATDFEPYAGDVFDVTFPSEAGTVYGGVLDLTAGTLTVDRAYMDVAQFTNLVSVRDVGLLVRRDLPAELAGVNSSEEVRIVCSRFRDAGGRAVEWGCYLTNAGRTMIFVISDPTVTTLAEANAWLADNPTQAVYRLAEPVVYQLTPRQIAALAGINTVFADCGPVSVEYVRDTEAVIDAGDADTRAMIGEASGTTASRSLAVGEYVTVGDKLYRVTAAVGQGETLVPGTNVTETTVGAELARIAAMIS